MKVIISGVGQVGYHIAEKLAQENHEITVIDSDPKAIDNIARVLDIDTILGSGSSVRILERAGIAKTDMFLACSSFDEINITSCIIAKNLYSRLNAGNDNGNTGMRTIARVRSQEYSLTNPRIDTSIFGVDMFINQDQITSQEIARIIEMPGAVEVIPFADDRVELVGFMVKEGSLMAGRRIMGLREIEAFKRTLIVAIQRSDELIIPTGNTKVNTDDILFFVGEKGSFGQASRFFAGDGANPNSKRRVFVLGGGPFTKILVDQLLLDPNMEIKMVDNDLSRVYRFSEEYPRNVYCLHGEATDLELLKEEGIELADHVIAATADEDTNIVASILCKEYGAKHTITIVQDPDYAKIKMMAGIDVAISPKILTSGEVLKQVRTGSVQKAAPLLEEGAEVLEVSVPDDNKRFGKPIRDIALPMHSIIGAVVRDRQVVIPEGSTMIMPKDYIIVFVLPDAKKAVENFFME